MNANEVSTVVREVRPWKNAQGYFLVVDQGVYAAYGTPDVKPGDYVKLELGPEGRTVGERQLVAHVRKAELQDEAEEPAPELKPNVDIRKTRHDLEVDAMKECIADARDISIDRTTQVTIAAALYQARAARALKEGGFP